MLAIITHEMRKDTIVVRLDSHDEGRNLQRRPFPTTDMREHHRRCALHDSWQSTLVSPRDRPVSAADDPIGKEKSDPNAIEAAVAKMNGEKR